MFRKFTNSSLQDASEAQRRPTFPSEVSTGRVQDRYPAYQDFPWEKIEEYLKKKWPNWDDFNAKHVSLCSCCVWQARQIKHTHQPRWQVGDSWEFEIPELLNEVSAARRDSFDTVVEAEACHQGDRKALRRLRDKVRTRGRSVSPE